MSHETSEKWSSPSKGRGFSSRYALKLCRSSSQRPSWNLAFVCHSEESRQRQDDEESLTTWGRLRFFASLRMTMSRFPMHTSYSNFILSHSSPTKSRSILRHSRQLFYAPISKWVEQMIWYPDPPASLRHITAPFLLGFSSNLAFSLAGLQVVALGWMVICLPTDGNFFPILSLEIP